LYLLNPSKTDDGLCSLRTYHPLPIEIILSSVRRHDLASRFAWHHYVKWDLDLQFTAKTCLSNWATMDGRSRVVAIACGLRTVHQIHCD